MSGEVACQTLMDELNVQAYQNPTFASKRDLAFDTYCMQHVVKYCLSAKSYAAHLTRLCCGLEYEGKPGVYAALQRWLNGPHTLEKPEVLDFLGEKTIVDVVSANSAEDFRQRVQSWAEDVWLAYASQQDQARAWVQEALKSQGPVVKIRRV